jgi:hypothetical protein
MPQKKSPDDSAEISPIDEIMIRAHAAVRSTGGLSREESIRRARAVVEQVRLRMRQP